MQPYSRLSLVCYLEWIAGFGFDTQVQVQLALGIVVLETGVLQESLKMTLLLHFGQMDLRMSAQELELLLAVYGMYMLFVELKSRRVDL